MLYNLYFIIKDKDIAAKKLGKHGYILCSISYYKF